MWQVVVPALLLGRANLAAGQAPIEIPQQEVWAHRPSGVAWIRAPGAGISQSLLLRIEVEPNGAVTSVKVTEGRISYLFCRRNYRPGGNVPFPTVHDWASVKIALKRTVCLGACPAYDVEIDGNGDVLFTGISPALDERRHHISREALQGLVEVFRKANYFSLDREYRIGATDLPTCITSISIDGRSMPVTDYGGLQVGMPTSIRDVEDAIDEVAGTSDWLKPSR